MRDKIKILAATFVTLFLISFLPTVIAQASAAIVVTIDGKYITFEEQKPFIIEGRTLVPVRGVFEHLGFDVDWNPETRQATLESDDFIVILTIDNDVFTVNSEELRLEVPAQIIGGSTMIPFRAVLESVGYYADWSAEERAVIVVPAVTIGGRLIPITEQALYLPHMNLTNEDIIPLRYMTNLNTLQLSANHISDISPLTTLTSLTTLSLDHTQIVDLSPLEKLVRLEHLELFGNETPEARDYTPLINLQELTFLGFGQNGISDLEPLVEVLLELPNLTRLSLSWNQISDISPLAELVNLEELWLHENDVEDISALAYLVNLTELRIPWNPRISDLSPLAGLTNLRLLQLGGEQTKDTSPLAHLTYLVIEDDPPLTD